MESNTKKKKGFLPRISQVAIVILVTCLSSYCTSPDKQTDSNELTADESYLVDTYVRIARTRDLVAVTPLKSDSFFAPLDSTVDTTRIANTIRALDGDPLRWIHVFEAIEHELTDEPDAAPVPPGTGPAPGGAADQPSESLE